MQPPVAHRCFVRVRVEASKSYSSSASTPLCSSCILSLPFRSSSPRMVPSEEVLTHDHQVRVSRAVAIQQSGGDDSPQAGNNGTTVETDFPNEIIRQPIAYAASRVRRRIADKFRRYPRP